MSAITDIEEAFAAHWSSVIARLSSRFRSRDVQFFWLVHLSARPADLGERLTGAGVPVVETATGVMPAARGRGVAGGLTALLVQRARDAGCRRVVLHSSEMAQGVYRRVGFVEQCRLPFHATTAIWSHER